MGAGGCVGLCVTQGRIGSTNQMAGLKTKSPFFILLLVVFFSFSVFLLHVRLTWQLGLLTEMKAKHCLILCLLIALIQGFCASGAVNSKGYFNLPMNFYQVLLI